MFGQSLNMGSLAASAVQVDYLVVAGGGGGGNRHGGGGGAGGLRTSTGTSGGGGSAENALEIEDGNYIITVGAGGSATPYNARVGNNGTTSSIAGHGITTVTSVS